MDSDRKKNRLQIWIALFATLIPVTTTVILNLSQEKIKQLSVYASKPEKIINTENKEFEKIKVYYDSIFVENIIIRHIVIENTGDYSIVQEDFYDSPLKFQFESNNENTHDKLPNILDVILVENANQQNSILDLGTDNNSFYYKPSLLNPGEKIRIDILTPNLSKSRLECIGKLKDGKPIILLDNDELIEQSSFKSFIKSIQQLFKFKWISVVLSICFSILVLLAGIGFIANSQDDKTKEFDLNILGWIVGIATMIIGILIICLTVAIIIV